MSRAKKALQKLLSGTKDKSLTFGEFESALFMAGWSLDRVKGSHHVYRSPKGQMLTIPVHGKTVKPVYIRQARRAIE